MSELFQQGQAPLIANLLKKWSGGRLERLYKLYTELLSSEDDLLTLNILALLAGRRRDALAHDPQCKSGHLGSWFHYNLKMNSNRACNEAKRGDGVLPNIVTTLAG